MSKHKHNYTQYSNKPKQAVSEVKMDSVLETAEDVVTKPLGVAKPELVVETVETKTLPTTIEGVVTGCAKLNVRAEANLFANIVCVLDASSEIEIDVDKSNNDWFYVCTATGVEGYCLRKYVEAHL